MYHDFLIYSAEEVGIIDQMPRLHRLFPTTGFPLLVLAIALTACRPTSKSAAPSSEDFKYGQDLIVEKADPSPIAGERAADKSKGVLTLTLQDQNDRGAEGIPVRVIGGLGTILWSDKDGRVRIEAAPGNYQFEIIAGCTDRLIVEAGGRGHGGVVAGTEVSGKLPVTWKHRIVPAIGAYPSQYPDWYIGQTIDVYYDVLDRCRDDKAPGGSFPSWAFRTSSNIEIVGNPRLTADDKAQSVVSVRCTATGEASLVAFDKKNPPDEFDLIRYMMDMAGSKMRCATEP